MSSLHKSDKKLVRSPLFYVGDKYKLLSQLENLFPDNIERFIEPFTGGGSVPLNTPANEYYLNDIDQNIVMIHKLLIESSNNKSSFFSSVDSLIRKYGFSRSFDVDLIPDSLRLKWKKTYYARYNDKAYRELRSDYNTETKKDITKLYLLLIYGFNRMIRFNSMGQFNVPVGNVDFNKNVVSSLNTYFDWSVKNKINWSNGDYLDFLKSFDYKKGDFVYLDPPYLITFSEYNKLWNQKNEEDLTQLLDLLNKKGVRFAVSNVTHYKGRINETFLAWSKKYNSHTIKSNYISYHDNSIKDFKEVLVTNY